jgi:NAD(P)-dependent dehydrogenase (short-subunit alcohol dehydrogenase family)
MTRALAVEWGPLGVRVNGVAPGPVRDTEGFARLSAFQPAEAAKKTAALLPLRRAGSPAEIAEAVVFLFLHRWITGETLRVDGGEAVARPPFVSPELYAMLRSARTTERSKL